jgi:hypothetical protein
MDHSIIEIWQGKHQEDCTISINSSPICDCDMPDKIFISSTWLAGCNNDKISSDETQNYHIWVGVTSNPFIRQPSDL